MCHYISFSKTCTNILFSPNQIHCLLEWFSPCLSWKTRLLFLHREWLWRDSGYHGLVFSIIWGKRWCDCVCVMGVMYRPGELLCSPGYVSRCYACRKAWVCSEESFLSPLLFSISHCIHEYINCEYINFSSIFNGVLVCVIYSLCCNGVCMCVPVMVLFITRVVGGEDRLAEGPTAVWNWHQMVMMTGTISHPVFI